ncbi:Exosome complex component MTR3 [Dirofilaria immitis]
MYFQSPKFYTSFSLCFYEVLKLHILSISTELNQIWNETMQHSSVKPVSLSNLLKRTEIAKTGTNLRRASNTFRSIVMQTVDGPKEITKNTDVDPTEGQICVFLKNASAGSGAVPGFSSISNKENRGTRNAIESALRSIVCLELFCKAQIDIEITVLNDDGGVLAAALIAASLALIDSGIQVYDVCVAAHIVMLADGHIIVDPSISSFPYSSVADSEDFPRNAHLSVTVGMMPSLNQLVCCEFVGIAEPNQLRHAVAVAVENSLKLYPLVRKTLMRK